MKRDRDAFGHALMDSLEGSGDAAEIIERDDGFIALSAGASAYFREPAEWGDLDHAALDAIRGRVLDVGCGAGRFALELQRRGHPVVAIDTSPLAIEVCRSRGVLDARVLSVTRIDRRLGPFDSIIMMGHNFGLFGDARRMDRLLDRMRRVLTPTGRIVAEGLDPYQTDEPLHHAYHERNRARRRMSGQIRMRVRYKTYRTPWFDYLFVSVEDLERLLAGSGWRLTRVMKGDGPSYLVILEPDPGAERRSRAGPERTGSRA
jgi:SAM-dependent methyltransferase